MELEKVFPKESNVNAPVVGAFVGAGLLAARIARSFGRVIEYRPTTIVVGLAAVVNRIVHNYFSKLEGITWLEYPLTFAATYGLSSFVPKLFHYAPVDNTTKLIWSGVVTGAALLVNHLPSLLSLNATLDVKNKSLTVTERVEG